MQPAVTAQDFAESPLLEQAAAPVPAVSAWSPARRILFRFVFSYLVLYNLPFPLDYIGSSFAFAPPVVRVFEMITGQYQSFWTFLVSWTGTHLFHADTSVLPNGSGDTTYNYVQAFCFLVIAAAVTTVWSILDRRQAAYPRLHGWLRVYVRFALGVAMISYGTFKVIKAQFPDPTLDRLLQPYGDASPMGLLWTFMGASTSYNVFAGAAEMLGGLLLTVRRTTLLGALVSFGALANIVALNFCYDVPVKLYSSHLLAMAVFLIVPEARRLTAVLLGRGAEPVELAPLFRRRWLDRGVLALCTLFVLAVTALQLYGSYQQMVSFRRVPNTPLHGLWTVDQFEVDGRIRPPLITDREQWRRVIVDGPGRLAIQLMSDSRVGYTLKSDKGLLTLGKRIDPKWHAALSYAQPKPDLLFLAGTFEGHTVRARLHREKPPKFLLTTRGFHWINERPFNR